ncbi:hypothetical protein G7054_g12428 [Neopestalotiopsis clavispora]|nr:hypothetical protein G7054_g12428 [Neopestalotiopsis clavispora]
MSVPYSTVTRPLPSSPSHSMTLPEIPINTLSSGQPIAQNPNTCEECQTLAQQTFLYDPYTCFQCHGSAASITSPHQPLRHYTNSLPEPSNTENEKLEYRLKYKAMNSAQSPTDLRISPPLPEPLQISSSPSTTTLSPESPKSPSSEEDTTRSADHDTVSYASSPIIHTQVPQSTRKPVTRSSTHRSLLKPERTLVERRIRPPSKRRRHHLLPLQMTRAKKAGRRLQEVARCPDTNSG